MMMSWRPPFLLSLGTGPVGRWKLWALAAAILLVATIGTWIAGQYQIGRLDSLKKRYEQPVQNFARMIGETAPHSMERDLLDGCKQAQVGTWLQTTDALHFNGPLTGNRVDVRLDPERAYIDLNGKDISECVQDEVEDRQFDIGSMTGTWSVVLLLAAFCMGMWSWICYMNSRNAQKSRNIYAETLAMAEEEAEAVRTPEPNKEEEITSAESGNITSDEPQADLHKSENTENKTV